MSLGNTVTSYSNGVPLCGWLILSRAYKALQISFIILQRKKLLEDRKDLGLGITELRKNSLTSKVEHLIRGKKLRHITTILVSLLPKKLT